MTEVESYIHAHIGMLLKSGFSGNLTHYEWFLEAMTQREVLSAADSFMRQPKRCINNSIDAAMDFAHMGYVEGWGFRMIPTVHAWNWRENSADVDFTWKDASQCEYWGVKIPLEIVHQCAVTEHWTMCTGVLETLVRMPKDEFEYAFDVIKEFNNG